MTKRTGLGLLSLAVLASGSVSAEPAFAAPEAGPEPVAALAHVAAAKAIGGNDLASIADGYICMSPTKGSAYVRSLMIDPAPRAPAAAFSDLYYVGLTFVGSWILKTPDGLIVWDTLNNEKEARTILEPGMKKLGLDPSQIKYVIVTHGHYDHFGGALYLQKTYGAKVMASAADWDYMYDAGEREKLHLPFVPLPERDGVIADGSSLTLGKTTVHFVITPGHTPGTVSSIFNVDDHGVQREVSMWGGTAMPTTSKGLGQYHDSLHKFWDASRAQKTSVAISSHAFVAGNFEAFDANLKDKRRNHFVIGTEGFDRFMKIYDECVVAMQARYSAWGW